MKILIFTTGEGHLSLAQAAKQIIKKKGFSVQLEQFTKLKIPQTYTPFYRYFPGLFKIPYKIGETEPIKKGVKIFLEKLFEKEIKKEIKEKRPDLIISTNFIYNPAIVKVLDYQKNPLPFINIVSDPWTIHPLILAPKANFNLVYDEKGVKIGRKNKIPSEKLFSLGWLVRNEFYQRHNLTKIRKKLGFKKSVFTLLICGGSEGTNMILKIIPALLTIKKPLQIILVCGTNERLYKAIFSFKKFIQKLNKTKINSLQNLSPKLNLRLFKFTNQLPQLMSIADLVIGKAGPNLLFETVAAKKPFFAICHISGQEDANLNLIKKKKLGLVEENPIKAIKLLQKIINHPKILTKFSSNIQKERSKNLQAEKKLHQIIKNLLLSSKTQRRQK